MIVVADLDGAALALYVARALGHPNAFFWHMPDKKLVVFLRPTDTEPFMPHEDWRDGGPLHDAFKVGIERAGDRVYAYVPGAELGGQFGKTALIAGARAIVASVYGSEVPDAG